MNRNLRNLITGVAIATATLGGAALAPAQNDPNSILNQKISLLEFQQTDVREALKALFRQVNANYGIANDVQGYVNGRLQDTTFEQALLFILRQVNATYRIEGSVFNIILREAPTTTNGDTGEETGPTKTATITRRIKIRSADPQLIARLIGTDKGQQSFTLTPELSQLVWLSQGGGGGGFGGGGGGFGGGRGF